MINDDDESMNPTLQKLDKGLKQLCNSKEKDISQKAIEIMKELEQIRFESQEFIDQVNEWDLDRVRLQEDLRDFERKLILEQEKKEQDNYDEDDDEYRADISLQIRSKKLFGLKFTPSSLLNAKQSPKSLPINGRAGGGSFSSYSSQAMLNKKPVYSPSLPSSNKTLHKSNSLLPSQFTSKSLNEIKEDKQASEKDDNQQTPLTLKSDLATTAVKQDLLNEQSPTNLFDKNGKKVSFFNKETNKQ